MQDLIRALPKRDGRILWQVLGDPPGLSAATRARVMTDEDTLRHSISYEGIRLGLPFCGEDSGMETCQGLLISGLEGVRESLGLGPEAIPAHQSTSHCLSHATTAAIAQDWGEHARIRPLRRPTLQPTGVVLARECS